MKVLLDTSVLLDLLRNRMPWAADMVAVWNAHWRGDIIRKQTDLATARTAVADCLATLHIAPVDQTALLAAQVMLPRGRGAAGGKPWRITTTRNGTLSRR